MRGRRIPATCYGEGRHGCGRLRGGAERSNTQIDEVGLGGIWGTRPGGVPSFQASEAATPGRRPQRPREPRPVSATPHPGRARRRPGISCASGCQVLPLPGHLHAVDCPLTPLLHPHLAPSRASVRMGRRLIALYSAATTSPPSSLTVMATARPASHVQQSRLEACWREQNCSSCVRSHHGCGWCSQVGSSIPFCVRFCRSSQTTHPPSAHIRHAPDDLISLMDIRHQRQALFTPNAYLG